MTDKTRYRLTGAIFLIAVAVIVLPMVFDGAGVEPVPVPPVEPVESYPVEPVTPKVDDDALAEASALRNSVDDEGFDNDAGVRVGEPALTDADDPAKAPVESWAVQLASFSEYANAVSLRDQLRKDGYASFLSELKRGASRSTRVAVGPIIERKEADRLRDELERRYSAKAFVVRFDE